MIEKYSENRQSIIARNVLSLRDHFFEVLCVDHSPT